MIQSAAMTPSIASAIYAGTVVHERLRPRHHRLRYRVFSLLLDLDELATLDRTCRFFGYNRWAPIAFFDRDHGPTNGAPLRPWAERHLRDAGIEPDGGAIRLLCYPRVFGYVFNPLSVFFCYRRDGGLAAILYEVCNVFSERHTYVIPVPAGHGPVVRQTCDKALYVSPFIDMDCRYRFRVLPPAERIGVVIRQEDAGGLLLAASFNAERRPLTAGTLLSHLARYPLMTVKVIAAIHWEALRLWFKRIPVIRHRPAAAPVAATVAGLDGDKLGD